MRPVRRWPRSKFCIGVYWGIGAKKFALVFVARRTIKKARFFRSCLCMSRAFVVYLQKLIIVKTAKRYTRPIWSFQCLRTLLTVWLHYRG